MNEKEPQQLIRHAVAESEGLPAAAAPPRLVAAAQYHVSHIRCALPSGAETDGPCLIEPSVMCDHCGYCLSYGH